MPAQDNREPEAPSWGNIIEELNGPGDRIPLWCQRRVTTGREPLPSLAGSVQGTVPTPVSLLLCPQLELGEQGFCEMERPGPGT